MGRTGFTLIEMVIVVLLLAALATIATTKLIRLNQDSKIATLNTIAGSMREGMGLVHLKAAIEDKLEGDHTLHFNGIELAIHNGYPDAKARNGFAEINAQLKAWVDIDVIDRNTIRDADGDVPQPFFSDRARALGRIYVFFSDDWHQKSASFECQVRYINDPNNTGEAPSVVTFTEQC